MIEKPDIREEDGGWRVYWNGHRGDILHPTKNAAYGEARFIRRELIRQFSIHDPGPDVTLH